MLNVRANESTEAKKNRLSKMQEYAVNVRANESTKDKKSRLSKMREHAENVRANESTKAKKSRLSKMQEHAVNVRHHCQSLSELINNFHNSVSFWPLYVCSCCDQLWYNHSVLAADRFTLQYPNTVK